MKSTVCLEKSYHVREVVWVNINFWKLSHPRDHVPYWSQFPGKQSVWKKKGGGSSVTTSNSPVSVISKNQTHQPVVQSFVKLTRISHLSKSPTPNSSVCHLQRSRNVDLSVRTDRSTWGPVEEETLWGPAEEETPWKWFPIVWSSFQTSFRDQLLPSPVHYQGSEMDS